MITDKENIKKVDIIIMNDGQREADIIREFLENLDIEVRFNYVGNAKHLISVMGDKKYLYEILIICCHGEENGIFLRELARDLEANMPFNRVIGADDLESFLELNNQLVINTGCCQGKTNFAKIFIGKGAKYYIAPDDFVESSSAILFSINFFYHYFAKNQTVEKAFDLASKIDEETGLFKYYQN